MKLKRWVGPVMQDPAVGPVPGDIHKECGEHVGGHCPREKTGDK